MCSKKIENVAGGKCAVKRIQTAGHIWILSPTPKYSMEFIWEIILVSAFLKGKLSEEKRDIIFKQLHMIFTLFFFVSF